MKAINRISLNYMKCGDNASLTFFKHTITNNGWPEKVAIDKSGANLAGLQNMPSIGPIAAMVIEIFAPDMQIFAKGRDFAAWLGLIPR